MSREYGEVEKATFTPLVLSASGGMACEATHFYKRLASCLAEKWDEPYSTTMAWLRCRISFSVLRSAIQSLRGAQSCIGHAVRSHASLSVVVTAEAKMTQHTCLTKLLCSHYITF